MKNGRTPWYTKPTRAALERLHAAIDANAETARAIFDRFNVQQYGITPRTFKLYCERRRRDWIERQESPADERGATAATLLQSIVDSLQISIDANRKIDGNVVGALQAAVQVMKLDLNREADRRANEKHAAWQAEYARKQAEALEAVAESGGLTPEKLAEIKSKVLGI